MCDLYGKACSVTEMFTNGLNFLKNIKIVFKIKTGQVDPQCQAHLKWPIQLMDSFWLRKITIDDISEQVGISMSTAHKNCTR